MRIRAGDRRGLEQLCRYVLRPPFAEGRLERLPDGRVSYRFKTPRPDGSTHAILTPVELLEKLAALVPPPRSHLVRYHGVLAPHAGKRGRIVPQKAPESICCRASDSAPAGGGGPGRSRRERTPWAALMRRTMGLDVLSCPRCHGRMELIAMIEEPEAIRKILTAMGLPTEVPVPDPPRPPPQSLFEFAQDSTLQ